MVSQNTENGYGTLKLSNPEAAVISQEKLQDYLLSETHPIGRFKAKLFRDLGYRPSHWIQLQTDLQGFLALDAIKKEKTPYGQKYEIRGELTGPNGKSINLVTAWIVLKTEDFPRFITAYPGE